MDKYTPLKNIKTWPSKDDRLNCVSLKYSFNNIIGDSNIHKAPHFLAI